jgi:membrane protease YdiL (CAAX protease family)
MFRPDRHDPAPRPRPDRTLALVLMAVTTLTVFYYLARADVVAVAGPAREFAAMTAPAVGFARHNLGALVLLGVAPLAFARLVCGLPPAALGFGAGDVSRGVAWIVVGVPVAVALARLSAGDPAMRAVYPLDPALRPGLDAFARHVAGQLAYYVAWEALFRGVLLFGLQGRLGFAGANVVQTALSALAHFGRPLPETLIAIPAGLAFGGVARHTRSIWSVVIIHLAAGAAQDWFIVH